jgi:hypothetical protein
MLCAGEKGAMGSDVTHYVVKGGNVLDVTFGGGDLFIGESGAEVDGVVEPNAVGKSGDDGGEGVHIVKGQEESVRGQVGEFERFWNGDEEVVVDEVQRRLFASLYS